MMNLLLFIGSLINLDAYEQEFVLETKKFEIPGYPDAFNPSIINWESGYLMVFRSRDPVTGYTDRNAFVFLDKEFNIVGDPKPLKKSHDYTAIYNKDQDPRLITIGDKLYYVYNNVIDKVLNREIRRMFVSELDYDGENFIQQPPQCLFSFDGQEWKSQEKNWAPFIYQDNLYLSYTLSPHLVLQPISDTSECACIAYTQSKIDWEWGELRGGTQAFLNGDHYLGFFHSCLDIASIQSDGKKMTHYFMGAYTFSAEPPFNLTQISPEPIVSKDFYNGKDYKTWKPLRVVFPCGFVFDDSTIWIAYGRQDFELWIVKLDKQKLLNSLIPVND